MRMRLLAVAAISAAALLGTSTMPQAQGAMRSMWDGVYTSAQADKGKALFDDNCAKCHGGTLEGNDEIPALKGSHFIADWESQSVADLIDRVHTTMPMDDPGKLSTPSATACRDLSAAAEPDAGGQRRADRCTAPHIRIDSTSPAARATCRQEGCPQPPLSRHDPFICASARPGHCRARSKMRVFVMRKRFTTIAVLTGAVLLGGTTLLYAQGALRSVLERGLYHHAGRPGQDAVRGELRQMPWRHPGGQ